VELKDYSQTELLLAVRQERHRLIVEKRGLTQRLATIGDRLDQLEKAENPSANARGLQPHLAPRHYRRGRGGED
jgi:hypothetical protein